MSLLDIVEHQVSAAVRDAVEQVASFWHGSLPQAENLLFLSHAAKSAHTGLSRRGRRKQHCVVARTASECQRKRAQSASVLLTVPKRCLPRQCLGELVEQPVEVAVALALVVDFVDGMQHCRVV